MRIGQVVDGGQVIAEAPVAGTVWATSTDQDLAGVVLGALGQPVRTLTREQQRTYTARAARIAAGGVQIARTPTGEYRNTNRWAPVREWTVHTLACDLAPKPLNPGHVLEEFANPLTHRWVLTRPTGIAAALADDPASLVPAPLRALVRRQPVLEQVSWCRGCLS